MWEGCVYAVDGDELPALTSMLNVQSRTKVVYRYSTISLHFYSKVFDTVSALHLRGNSAFM